jgi:tetratricopeptide (TPR) repeat protein/transcriptional regulator with XRE-family HTH domain
MTGAIWPAYCWCKIGSGAVLGSRGGRSRGGCWAVAELELSFAGLLRQLRAEARLTQEELAEAASLSPQAVSTLERGLHRTAHKDTAVLLADALDLDGPVAEMFVAAARSKAPAADVLTARRGLEPGAFAAAATQALPRDIGSFTGRQAELARLMGTLAAVTAGGGVVGIHAIDGMAGIGKTTFAVHAAHRLAESFPDGQFFLPLHAHTRGQRPVDPADALASLLLTAGVAAAQIPPGLEARAARWRDQVAGKRVLLLLDDAAGHEQVRPLLPGTAGSLVLNTSRRRLTAVEDAAVISLDTLSPGEGAALLARLAARPGFRPGDPAVAEITRLCGYLPLAIAMLASQLRHHPSWPPSRLADGLAATKDRLALMHAENLSVATAFDLSYADLTPGSQQLFRRLGLVPGPDFDAHAAAALDGIGLDEARRLLDELYNQHLIGEPAPGRYRLHDLLREHAQALAAANAAESDQATGRLLDYYLHTALAASQHITTQMTPIPPVPTGRRPDCVPQLSTPGPAAAWLEVERANLHAAAGYAAACGRSEHAVAIPAAMADFLDARGHWHQAAALHRSAFTAARQAGDRAGQAGALTNLCSMQGNTGNYRSAAASATQALALYRDLGDRAGQANALNNLGIVQRCTGDHQAAAASCGQALELFRDLGHRYGQGDALDELGIIQMMAGNYAAAAESLQQALALYRDIGHRLGEAGALVNLGTVQRLTGDYQAAATSQRQVLEQFRDVAERSGQARARNELGLLQQLAGDYPAAAVSHHEALDVFRDLGCRPGEADALTELGIMQQLTGNYPAAAASLQQAMELFGDLGNLQAQAYVLNGLGMVQQETGDYPAATATQQQALALFRGLGNRRGQAYVLNGIGVVQRETGDYPAAAGSHQQALALFRDFGDRLGQAEALNRLGELSSRTSATSQARDQHTQALAIAHDISVPLEQAHALEGLGRVHLQDGNPSQAAVYLQQALAIYQHLGAPAAQRVQETLQRYGRPSTAPEPQLAAPGREGRPPRTRTAPTESQ